MVAACELMLTDKSKDFTIEFFGDSWDDLIRALLESGHFNNGKK